MRGSKGSEGDGSSAPFPYSEEGFLGALGMTEVREMNGQTARGMTDRGR